MTLITINGVWSCTWSKTKFVEADIRILKTKKQFARNDPTVQLIHTEIQFG